MTETATRQAAAASLPRRLTAPVGSIDSQLDRRDSKTRSDAATKVLTPSAAARNRQSLPASVKTAEPLVSPPRPNLRPRASYQTSVKPAISIVEQERRVRRPVSFPDGLADEAAQSTKASSVARSSSLKQSSRRLPASRSTNANGRVTPDGPRTSLSARQAAIEEAVSPTTRVVPDPKTGIKVRARTLPDLPSYKPPSSSGPSDENQDQSLQRPPVSYKPPVNGASAGQPTASTAVRVPPIRAFRSSGSRKSSVDDMNYNSRSYDVEDRYVDSTDDHTLRALDGDFFDQRSPPTSRHGTNGDDTGDVFLKIASEEAARNSKADSANDGKSQYQVNRTTNRRPLSYHPSSHYPMSPPSVNRRLSDQQDRDRSRSVRYEDELTSEIARTSSAYRSQLRDKATSSRSTEDTPSRSNGSGLRPSLMTPRTASLQDQAAENSPYSRRRSSVVDAPVSSSTRSSSHKATVLIQSQNKTYNPSPLTRSFEIEEDDDDDDDLEAGNLAEGTESTTSTNAPSTVWDELDELKSRIHRLELTGKLPPTSAAALIKASEERPPTATTTVTTMSLSPKKSAAGQQTDAGSSTSSQREAHSNLHSALTKIKTILSPEVYRALETAANDALALSSMMGTPGQPGPISGSASVVGGGGGGGGPAITDRQLRRRTDSVCRSLTELCIALGEGTPSRPAATTIPQVVMTQISPNQDRSAHLEPPKTPTMMNSKTYSVSRRSSVVPDQATQIITSPRAMSKFEERRNMILNGSLVTSPRNSASTPTTPNESIARRASLIVSRARRAVTEEPEDGRRSSALLRRRAAGDDSDDGGRRTSFLVRNRRGTVGEEDEGSRFRAPSRAITEVSGGGSRGATKEYLRVSERVSDAPTPLPEADTPQPPSALSRRRFISSNLQPSRLTVPSTSGTPSTRKFLERSLPDGTESGSERPAENRLSRHLSVQNNSDRTSTYHSLQSRTSSLQIRRANRDSMVLPASSTTATNGLR
ncbi:hypothetical protein TrVFT333_008448 [Trichoderma virens FT-333]|nr:hypothetical protein TrVFT333_008448 [Trichoderma virens FT-333]